MKVRYKYAQVVWRGMEKRKRKRKKKKNEKNGKIRVNGRSWFHGMKMDRANSLRGLKDDR
jgi:hypothetical protein